MALGSYCHADVVDGRAAGWVWVTKSLLGYHVHWPSDNTLFSAAAAHARGLATADGFVQIRCERRRTCLRRAAPGSGTSLTAGTLGEMGTPSAFA